MYYNYAKGRATQVPSLDNRVVAILYQGYKVFFKDRGDIEKMPCMHVHGVLGIPKLNSVVVDNGTLIVSQGHR